MRAAVLTVLMGVVGLGSFSALATAPDVQSLPGLTNYVAPKFPMELRGVKQGDGLVVMALTIDAQGKVSDSIALAASHDAFVHAVIDAIADWTFAPVSGSTAPRRETVEFEFKRQGVITTLTRAEAAHDAFVSASIVERKTVQWHELDAEPTRLESGMPRVSKAALKKLGGKPLMINFVIDAQGRVRIPVISTSEDPELSEKVLEAVRQWRYSPPLHKGNPVAVEVTRSLVLPQ